MKFTNWLKQSKDKPLFEDILWLKPENPHQRPKVVIIGGSIHGFASTTKLYDAIKSKAAYQTRVILPKSLEKILGHAITDAVFVETTSTGEISHEAKNAIRSAIAWADAVIFSDDLGNNSQTEILVTELLDELDKPTYFLGQTLEILNKVAQKVIENPYIILVGELAQISKFNSAAKSQTALLQADGLVKLAEKFQTVSADWLPAAVTNVESQILVAESGQVSTTKSEEKDWIIPYTANSVQYAKIFNQDRFRALTTAAVV